MLLLVTELQSEGAWDETRVPHVPQLVSGLLVSDSGSECIGSAAKVVYHLVGAVLAALVIGWPDMSLLSAGAAGVNSRILMH